MTDRVEIMFAPTDGIVVRLLGLIERRGFRLGKVAMAQAPCGTRASIAVDVDPYDQGRRIEVLIEQLRKQHGIAAVTTTRGETICPD